MTAANRYSMARNRQRIACDNDPAGALCAALTAAGREVPASLRLVDTLADVDDLSTVRRRLGTQALQLDIDPEIWLPAARAELLDALVADELRRVLVERDAHLGTQVIAQAASNLDMLTDPVTAQLEAIARLAAKLPAGPRPLDPQSAIDHGKAPLLREVGTRLEAVGTMLGLLPPPHPRRGAGPGTQLAEIVATPNCEPAPADYADGDDPIRESVKQWTIDINVDGIDNVLVRTARGDYPHLTIDLIDDLDERAERIDNLVAAHARTRTRTAAY